MIEKFAEAFVTGTFRKWQFLPLFWWLFLIVLWILSYDPLSPTQADAQKLWDSVVSFSPIIVKYGNAIIIGSFVFAFVFESLSFVLYILAKRDEQGMLAMAIGGLSFYVFIFTGSLVVTFSAISNSSTFWSFNSATDDLVKLAAFLYVLILLWANYQGFLDLILRPYRTADDAVAGQSNAHRSKDS